MAQALVQINAPADIRGRVVGLFNMAGLGMRAFSGITVGLAGAAIGIHWSLGLSAAVLLVFLSVLYRRAASSGKSPSQGLKDELGGALKKKSPAFRRGLLHSLTNPASDPDRGSAVPDGWGSASRRPGSCCCWPGFWPPPCC